ncbi:MAG: D-glycero-beta-D-manno-heptose 1-phosphate adenylyltransferase [Calditrichaeota bacterium]|nr:MAG: D-glycero-beta-D-manno-heptose 1-phosphate adenylyltransferase [Calditrichota bacterium]
MDLNEKIVDLEQAVQIRSRWKDADEKVVFTNGCFDILHPGHVLYLTEARMMGDHMILGLNTDASVQRLKGPGRPIQSENDRAIVAAGLWAIDLIVLFDEDTPYDLIKTLMPDVLVKGGDYTFDTIVGAPVVAASGGEVKTIDFVEGKSTTRIISKMIEK